MPERPGRDLELTRTRLTAWLADRLPQARDLALSTLASPSTSGYSNDTLLFDATWREGGATQQRSLVARIEPTGLTVFPAYDLGREFRLLQILAGTDVPVPPARCWGVRSIRAGTGPPEPSSARLQAPCSAARSTATARVRAAADRQRQVSCEGASAWRAFLLCATPARLRQPRSFLVRPAMLQCGHARGDCFWRTPFRAGTGSGHAVLFFAG